MSNLLNFKFGQYANLPASTTAGNVYVTTDEKAMYVDLPNSEGVVSRLRIGDIVVKNSVRDAEPPFYADAFYYFIEENALLRWNATGGENGTGAWVQINKSKDLESAVSGLSTKVDGIDTRLGAAEKAITDNKSAVDTAIGDLNTAVEARVTTEEFNTFKTSNDEAIADAKKAGTDAATAAASAQGTADQAILDAAEAKRIAETKATLEDVADVGYALDTDAQGYASAVLGTAEDTAEKNTVYGAKAAAAAASSAASAAQSKADSAYTLAEGKIDLAGVEALDYATKDQAKGYANAVVGATTDQAGDATVHGALKSAAAAQSKANDAYTLAQGANTLAGEADALAKENKGKIEAIQGAGYITIAPVNALKEELVGEGEATENVTIQRAIADAKAAKSAADTADGKAVAAQGTADQAIIDAKAADDKAVAAQGTADQAKADAAAANANANNRVLTSDFEAFEITNTAAINAASGAASAAQGTADSALAAAGVADGKAVEAKNRADEAYDLAEEKATLADVETAGYAKTGYVDTQVSGVDTKVTNLSTKVDGVESTANNALSRVNGGTMEADINMDGNAITNLKAPTADADAATKKYVDDAVASGIGANDAMTFKGVVGGEGATLANLPTSGVQKGDTYKVGAVGTYNGQDAKIGDLFICTSEDNAEEVVWVHISSGYEDDYLQKVGADAENATVYLTDGVNDSASQGGIKFVSENSGLKLEVVENEDGLGKVHTVKASFVWEEFTA